MDLKITKACLPGRTGQWDIGIAAGSITAIAPYITDTATTTLDASGHLIIPGLVDAHIHLDKALLLDRCQSVEGTFDEAMRETLRAKQCFTVEDIRAQS